MRFSFPNGLTRQSIGSRSISFRVHGPSEVLVLGGRVRTVGDDAVRRAREGRSDAAVRGGRCGTASGCTRARAASAFRPRAQPCATATRASSWRSHTVADRGHDRAGVDAQDAAARDRDASSSAAARSRSTPPGLLDESAGRHARRTAWRWSAGAGVAESGAAVMWNLVEGLHDGSPSERTVWVDGEPHALRASAVRRPRRRRRPALHGAGRARQARELPRHRLRLRAALRHLHRRAADRRRPARLGRHGTAQALW